MKLHDPHTERALVQIALQVRQGREMARSDGPGWFRRMLNGSGWGYVLLIGFPYLNSFPLDQRSQPWQILVYSLVLMVAAWQIRKKMDQFATSPAHYPALVNLPIKGEKVLSWVRYRVIRETSFVTLVLCILISVALHGFSMDCCWVLVATTFLLFSTVFATALLSRDTWVQRSQLPKVWGLIVLSTVIGAAYILFAEKKALLTGGMPEWVKEVIAMACWVLPPSWVMPGHLEVVGGYLAAVWIIWGLVWWSRWPKAFAMMIDDPEVFFGSLDFDPVQEEEAEELEIQSQGSLVEEAMLSDSAVAQLDTDHAQILPLPKPLTIRQQGWVEALILRAFTTQDRHLLGAMIHPQQTWTKRTNVVMAAAPVFLLASWLFMRFFPKGELWELLYIWGYMFAIGFVTLGLLPFSNAIPRATDWWSLGTQMLPFFSALPLSARDLLRISSRVTWVRSLIMVAILCPYALALSVILEHGQKSLSALWLVPATGLFWALSRPIFLWYRLQAMSKRRRGMSIWVWHALASLLIIILGFAWLILGAAGVLTGIALFNGPHDVGGDVLMSIACVLGSGVCARLVFEIQHWRLRLGHFDWLSATLKSS